MTFLPTRLPCRIIATALFVAVAMPAAKAAIETFSDSSYSGSSSWQLYHGSIVLHDFTETGSYERTSDFWFQESGSSLTINSGTASGTFLIINAEEFDLQLFNQPYSLYTAELFWDEARNGFYMTLTIPAAVPEPTTYALGIVLTAGALCLLRRKCSGTPS